VGHLDRAGVVIDHGFEEHLVERGSVGGLEVGQSLVGEHPGHVTRATGATAHPAHVLGYGLAPLLRWSRVAGSGDSSSIPGR